MDITILIAIGALIILLVVYTLVLHRRIYRKLNFMIDALEDNETNFKYSTKGLFSKKQNTILNRIRDIFKKERALIAEQEAYYCNMLNHVNTGVLALREDGRIEFMNSMAIELMQVGMLTSIKQLKNVNNSLYQAIVSVTGGKNIKAEYYNECSKKSILLSASYAVVGGVELKIIAMNDISAQLNENEEESWSKLTRVLTHEIMNTITPIASLSETLLQYSEGADGNIKDGLTTISAQSRNLIKFVESYRSLTRVPLPNKKAFVLKELVEKVFSLTSEMAEKNHVEMTFVEHSKGILLYADEGQISQILINLVKNAIQAGAGRVTISATIDFSENTVIDVANNGAPIEKENTAELFVPFYTTKSEGTGIGLSLSRQIMRMHNGTLNLTKSDPAETVFTLIF